MKTKSRLVIDSRELNLRSTPVQHPIPISDQFFNEIAKEGFCVFTNLDATAMYYQFLVDTNSAKRYLAFHCPSLS